MTAVHDCIFCKIIKGDIPGFKILEDDKTIAFMDINPVNPGHILVVPKAHAPDIFEIAPDDWAACMVNAQKVAKAVQQVLTPDGINIMQANGIGAGQSVFHVHVHVMPRQSGDDLKMNREYIPGDMEEIGQLAEKITTALLEQ